MQVVTLKLEKSVSRRNQFAVVSVNADGQLSKSRLSRHCCTSTEQEAQALLDNMLKWNPGKQFVIVQIADNSYSS